MIMGSCAGDGLGSRVTNHLLGAQGGLSQELTGKAASCRVSGSLPGEEKGMGGLGCRLQVSLGAASSTAPDADSAFYFERRGAGSCEWHLEGSSGCRRCPSGTLTGTLGHQDAPLATRL